jgi:hypothetical protein
MPNALSSLTSCLILDITCALGNFVIKLASSVIRFLRNPIQLASALARSPLATSGDDLPRHTLATRCLADKQIFQIAIAFVRPCGAMHEDVCKAEQLPLALSHQAMQRMRRIEHALPSERSLRIAERHLIKRKIALPQRQPSSMIVSFDRANL